MKTPFSGMDGEMTQGHFNLKHSIPNIKNGRSREKRPTKDQVASKQQPQWDPNEHPIFGSGMDGGMTQGHLHLKHVTPNIKDGCSRAKRPTKDQVTSKQQPQWDPYEHPIFSSGMDGGMTQGHFNLKHSIPNIKDGRSRAKRPNEHPI